MTQPSPSPALTDEDQALRKALAFACNDPGHFVGFKGERSLGQWQADSLLAGPLATLRARATAAEAALLEKDGEIERLKAALRPFADLWFSFDGFSAEPAALVFCHREYGQWRCDHHSAFDKMIEAARAALAPTEPLPATDDEASHVSGS